MFRHLSRNRRSASVARILSRACMFETLEKRQLMSGTLRVIDEAFVYDASQQSLRFTFNDNVSSTFTNSDIVSLVHLTTATTISSPLGVTFPQSNVASITFPTTYLADGDWQITLGADGANQVFEFSFFRGDANADSKVDIADLYIVASNYLTSGKTYSQGDFDYDGDVDNADYSVVVAKWQATTFDVSIDSDNGDTSGFPDSSIEENVNKPGKIVAVSNGDSDIDGIVDFADGYSLDPGNSDTYDSYNLQFAPIKVTLPSGVTLSNPKLKVFYDYSDPRAVTGDTTDGYALPSGSLRLWREPAAVRSYEAVVGSLSGTDYTGAGLTTLGLASAGASVTWYVEAVRASASMADQAIRIEYYPDDNHPTHKYVDTVRLTAMSPGAANFGDAASDRPGGISFGADGGDPASLNYNGPVRYADGTVTFTSTDLDPAEAGILSGQTRTWSSIPSHGANGTNGNGWTVSQWPSLVQGTNSILVSSGGRSSQWFDYSGSAYTARLFSLDLLAATGGGGFVLTDTLGNQSYFYGFAGVPAKQRGQLEKFVDSYGNETTFVYDGNGVLETVKRMPNASDSNPSVPLERLEYSYSNGLLSSVVMYRRDDQNDPLTQLPVRQVNYTYYGAGNDFGNPGDLNTVTVQQPVDPEAGTLTWFDVEHKLYRYDGASRLILVLEGASYERAAANLTLSSASTSALGAYADYVFDYYATDDSDPLLRNRVKSQKVQGAGTFAYDYVEDSGTTGINSWQSKVIEYLPDSTLSDNTDNDQRVVYSNFAYETMASIFMPDGVTDEANGWVNAYRYDADGRILREAMPSSVTDVDSTQSSLVTLSSNSGLIYTSSYLSNGYLEEVGRAHGDSTPIIQRGYTYLPRPSASGGSPTSKAYLLHTDTVYRDDSGLDSATTTYTYSYYSGIDGVVTLTTALPVVDAGQNGAGTSSYPEESYFDEYGRITLFIDADGRMNNYSYVASTGALESQILDWQNGDGVELTTMFGSDLLGRVIRTTGPNGNVTAVLYDDTAEKKRILTTPPSSGAQSPPATLSIDDRAAGTIDVFGLTRDSSGDLTGDVSARTTTFVNESQQIIATERYFFAAGFGYDFDNDLLSGSGARYRTEYAYDPRGRLDRVSAGRDEYTGTMSATNPTITRTVFDGLDRPVAEWIGTDDSSWSPSSPGSNMTKTSAKEYDGGSVVGGDVGDSNLTKTTEFPDTVSSHARETDLFYDWRDRLVATKRGAQVSEASGINRPISYDKYDNLDRPVMQYVFDGDGVAVTSTAGVPNLPAASLLRSATLTQYDDRQRVFRTSVFNISQTAGISSTNDIYDTSADSLSTLSAAGIATLQGLRSDFWYDDRNNLVKSQSPGGLVKKLKYDGANRVLIDYTTDGGVASGSPDSTWADALNVDDDIVLEQVETTYDDDSNSILIVTKQRYHDETATGALEDGSTTPKARTSYIGNWYDENDRLVTSVNWGNNGGTAPSRPSSPGARTGGTLAVPNADGFDPYLRSDYTYNTAGYLQDLISPRQWEASPGTYEDIKTRTFYDSLGRATAKWDAYEDGTPGLDNDRGTIFEYNAYDQITKQGTRSYANSTTRDLDNTYVYGVTKAAGNGINHSGLLNRVIYGQPTDVPSSTDFHGEQMTYNALGEVIGKTEVAGPLNASNPPDFVSPTLVREHQYSYTVLGQLNLDTWTSTAFPSMADTGRKLAYNYDALGRGTLFSTLNSSGTFDSNGIPVTGNVVNQVERVYDGLGNLIADNQEHQGAVDGSTLATEYDFESDYTNNFSRLAEMIYPNGRSLQYVYGYQQFGDTSVINDLNDAISRVGFIADDSGSDNNLRLEYYEYLGLDRVVTRNYPRVRTSTSNPSLTTFTGQTYIDILGDLPFNSLPDDAGSNDPYDGLDRFGRVLIHEFWPEIRVYAYDADGNVLSSWNPNGSYTETWRSELFQGNFVPATNVYDKLGRIQTYRRGQLVPPSTLGDRPQTVTSLGISDDDFGVPIPTLFHSFAADNDGNYHRDSSLLDQSQQQLFQRDVPSYSSSPFNTTDPIPERRDVFIQYDGWGRLAVKTSATLKSTGSAGAWVYEYDAPGAETLTFEYDALGRRISETDTTADVTDTIGTLHLCYDAAGNVISEHQESSGSISPTPSTQYVWSAAEPGAIVARDADADGNAASDDYGFANSGLDERYWAYTGADNSVIRIRKDKIGNSANRFEQFTYSSEGVVTISGFSSGSWEIRTNPAHEPQFSGDPSGTPDSDVNWRYLWRGGRDDGDGFLMMPGGQEQDTKHGVPLGEDAFAYRTYVPGGFFDAEYNKWTTVQERHDYAGTQGQWSSPSTDDGWLTSFGKALFNPSAYGAMGQVSNTDPYHVAKISGWVGTVALTLATGGAYGGLSGAVSGFGYLSVGVAAGAVAGGAYSNYSGNDFWSSVEVGANLGAFVGSFPGAINAAGAKFLQYGDEGAQGLLAMLGRMGPPPAWATVTGRTIAGAGGAGAALEAGAFAGAGVNLGGLAGLGTNVLFSMSPSASARRAVQGSYLDPRTNQVRVSNARLAADHFVPQVQIKEMRGFASLTPKYQNLILNDLNNLQGLPTALNSSKGGLSPSAWTTFRGVPLAPDYVARNQALEPIMRSYLQSKIDFFLAIQ